MTVNKKKDTEKNNKDQNERKNNRQTKGTEIQPFDPKSMIREVKRTQNP
jgi:hypothetical protein